LGADVHLELQQLVRLRHPLGSEHLPRAKLDLHEIVDRDAIGRRARGCARGGDGRGLPARRGGGGRIEWHGWNERRRGGRRWLRWFGVVVVAHCRLLLTRPQRTVLCEAARPVRTPAAVSIEV